MIGCRRVEQGWELRIHVQPGASKTELAGVFGEAIRIRLAAPALEGRANRALIDFLSRLLDVPRRHIAVLSGEHGRDKRLLIRQDVIEAARLAQLGDEQPVRPGTDKPAVRTRR